MNSIANSQGISLTHTHGDASPALQGIQTHHELFPLILQCDADETQNLRADAVRFGTQPNHLLDVRQERPLDSQF